MVVQAAMTKIRIALANIEIPASPEDSVARVLRALPEAASAGARVLCFPEAYVPGYRWEGRARPLVRAKFLDEAHAKTATAAAHGRVALLLCTERWVKDKPRCT